VFEFLHVVGERDKVVALEVQVLQPRQLVEVSYARRRQLVVRQVQHFQLGKVFLTQTRNYLYVVVLQVDIDEGLEVTELLQSDFVVR